MSGPAAAAVEALLALPFDYEGTRAAADELYETGALLDDIDTSVDKELLVVASRALRHAATSTEARQLSTRLAEAGVQVRALVVVLYRLMHGCPRTATERVESAVAASCYVLLARCAGEAWQPMVFRRALGALRGRIGAPTGAKRKAVAERSAPAKRGAAVGEDEEEEDDDVLGDDGDELRQRRWTAVEDVAVLVSPGPFSLSGHADSVTILIEVMVDLVSEFAFVSTGEVAAPLRALGSVLTRQHGNTSDTMKLVFQGLLPLLLTSRGNFSGATVSKSALACRDATVGFISSLMIDTNECNAYPVNIVALCQHICMKVSDKREFRASACQTVIRLLLLLPEEQLSHFARFLTKYSKNEKALYRHFACDISLVMTLKLPPGTLNKGAAYEILKGRASDKAPTVRTKAISQLSTCLDGPYASDLLGDGTAVASLLTLARARSRDEKGAVRKVGVQLLCAVLRRLIQDAADLRAVGAKADESINPIDPGDVRIIAERCRDSSLVTRKAALQMLTELLQAAPMSVAVQDTWLKVTLPAILDQQPSMVDICCSVSSKILLESLVESSEPEAQNLSWRLLNRIRSPDSLQCLHKIVETVHTNPKFPKIGPAQVKAANAEVKNSGTSAIGAWLLLAELSNFVPNSIDADLTWNAWEHVRGALVQSDDDSTEQYIAVHVLRTLGNCLRAERAVDAGNAIAAAVLTFKYTPQVTKAALECLGSISSSATGPASDELQQWTSTILSSCDDVLYNYMFGDQVTSSTEGALHNSTTIALFIVGEISMMCSTSIPKRAVSVLQALVNPAENAEEGNGVRVSVPESVRAHAIVALGKVCLNNQGLAKKCVAAFARELQGNRTDAAVIRNNIIFILSDLCRRFTSLVDPHLPLLSRCLGDPLPLVRKQTMILLAGLLQEDYLKWKGPLFFRFLTLAVDVDLEIASQAKFILFNLFHKTDDKLLARHFVEAVFTLNGFCEHETYNQFKQSDSDRALFCMPGKELQAKRRRIYSAMLEPMSDENRLHITARLCHEILARATDTDKASAILDPTNDCAGQVLHDAMVILASDEIKLASSARKSALEADGDIEPELQQPKTAEAAASAATSRVLSQVLHSFKFLPVSLERMLPMRHIQHAEMHQVAKKGTVEQTLPILIEVRRLLMERKSPLLRALMTAVRETIKDYQAEVNDILSDRQLAAEIMYDLDQMKLEAEQARRASQSPRGIAAPSPRVSNGSARLSVTPAKPRSLKDTFTPAVSTRGSSAGNDGSKTTPFSVPRLRRPSGSPALSSPKDQTFAVPKAKTGAGTKMPPPSPLSSSRPLRVNNKHQADILLPSPFKSENPPRLWGVSGGGEMKAHGGTNSEENSEVPMRQTEKRSSTRSSSVAGKTKSIRS